MRNITQEDKIKLANSIDIDVLNGILNEAKNQYPDGLIGKDEFETVVRTVTIDSQASLIGKAITLIAELKEGLPVVRDKIYEEEQ